jgi:hypothetical protein
MTEGGYMIVKKNGKVSQEFGSAAKTKRFANENRYDHRGEYRKTYRRPRGLLVNLGKKPKQRRRR